MTVKKYFLRFPDLPYMLVSTLTIFLDCRQIFWLKIEILDVKRVFFNTKNMPNIIPTLCFPGNET